MPSTRKFILSRLLAGALVMPVSVSAENLLPVIPSIEIPAQDDSVDIHAFVTGQPPQSVSATLVIARTSQSGNVSTSQSRDITFESVGRVEVAKTGLSLGKDAKLSVELVVESDGVVIARSRTSIGDDS